MSAFEYVTLGPTRPTLVRQELPIEAAGAALETVLRTVNVLPLIVAHAEHKEPEVRVHLWHELIRWLIRPAAPVPANMHIVELPLHRLEWERALQTVADTTVVYLAHDRREFTRHAAEFEGLVAELAERLRHGEAAEVWTGIAEDVVTADTDATDAEAFRRAAQRRECLIAKERWLLSDDIAQRTRGAPAATSANQYTFHRRQAGQLLGVRHHRQHLHPACQFQEVDGRLEPLPVLPPLFELLPKDDSGWTQAFWLFQPTGRLGGARPADVLATHPNDVLLAAKNDFHGDDGI